jgi:hypothetical protein
LTAKIQRNLRKLRANVRRNRRRVAKKLSRSGTKPNPAVVYSVAKYYKALEKLAKE